MNPDLLLIVGIAIAALVIGVLGWRVARRRAASRTAAFQHQALVLGFALYGKSLPLGSAEIAEADPRLAVAFQTLQLFRKRRSARISNLLVRGENRKRTDWVFDFSFQTGSGNNRSTVRQTVLGCFLADREFPSFTVQPEGLFSRLFDGADIDFEQDVDFSKKYLLKGQDPHRVRRTFTPYVRSLLSAKKNWTLEASGAYVFACRKGRRIDPADLLSAQAEFNRLLDAMCAGE